MSEKISYIKKSPITGRKYDYFSDDIVRILNFEQVFYYTDTCGIVPLDIVLSNDRQRNGKKIILFLFSKKETHDAYIAWCNRDREKEVD